MPNNNTTLNQLPLPVIVVKSDACIFFVNQEAHKQLFSHTHWQHTNTTAIKFTQLSSHYTISNFEQDKAWLKTHSQQYTETELILDRAGLQGHYRIRLKKWDDEEERYLITFEDIASFYQSESAIKRSFRELKAFSRISAMRELSTIFAHRLNQPLTALLSYTQAMQRLYGQQAKNREKELTQAMDRVVVNAQKAGQIIRDIRMQITFNNHQCRFYDLNKLINEVLNLTELTPTSTTHDHSIKLNKDLGVHLPFMYINVIQVKQVILSLLRNAIDAVSTAGTHQSMITLKTSIDSQYFIIGIIDNGPGIENSVKSRLFEPFVTSKVGGLGLGLSMCRSIIEQYGGNIKIDSDTSGTQVFVLLPLYTTPAITTPAITKNQGE